MKKFFFAFAPMYVVFIVDLLLLLHVPWFERTIWASSWSMHLIGGIVTGWSIIRVFSVLKDEWAWKITPKSFFVFSAWCAVALVVVGWEWYERVLDMAFGTNHQLGLNDTMVDMALGLLGGALFLGCWFVNSDGSKQS